MASTSVIVPTRIDIRDFMVAHFSRGELMLFCADYFVDFYSRHEGLTTPLDALAQALLEHCEHRGLLDNLATALEKQRAKPWRERFSSVITTHNIVRNPNQVFISYATLDEEFARKLAADLRVWDVPVWAAFDCIQRGELWADAIDHALQASGICIVMLTPHSAASRWVKKELRVAERFEHAGQMKIIPLDLQACNWNLLSSFLADFQAISFRENYETGLRDLRDAIGAQPPLIERLKAELSAAKQHIAQLQAELQSARQYGSQADLSATEITNLKAKIVALTAEMQTKDMALQTAQTELRKAQAQIAQLQTELNAAQAVKTAPTGPNLSPNPDRIVIEAPIRLELVRVPAGEFLMGSDSAKDPNARDNEKPQHRMYLSEYYIGKTPVTNTQYAVFAKATNRIFDLPKGKQQHPVVKVSWHDAVQFCEWLTAQTKQVFRLPTEAEWEKAARGTDGRVYPWVGGGDAEKCNTSEGGIGDTTPVGKYSPAGDSPYDCVDMVGNVWEWCVDDWDDAAYAKRVNQEVIDPKIINDSSQKVVRGGSWDDNGTLVRAAFRSFNRLDYRFNLNGFRLVSSAPLFSALASV